MSNISISNYKDERAIVLENDVLRAEILPEWGSKFASIVYKPLEYELLWQNPGKEYKKTSYGDSYEAGELSGFDEMFPTISRCFYENDPWAGKEMPDHGEVWSIPWEYETGDDSVLLCVYGVRFPYKLEKRVSLENTTIRITYRATNLSDFDFDFIWSAHPLLNTSEGMEFIVPPSMNKILNSVPGPRLRSYGKVYDFPFAGLEDGSEFNLGVVPPKNDFGYQKYFFAGKVTEGWCMLYDRKKMLTIGMSYPKEKVPYLGMWLNEGGYEGQYNIAPEPATGGMDRVDFSKMWGMNSVLEARGSYSWHLNISLKEGEKARGITEDGVFVM